MARVKVVQVQTISFSGCFCAYLSLLGPRLLASEVFVRQVDFGARGSAVGDL